jgi:hypothetical protein
MCGIAGLFKFEEPATIDHISIEKVLSRPSSLSHWNGIKGATHWRNRKSSPRANRIRAKERIYVSYSAGSTRVLV